jgi:hypothetical protein
MGDKRNNAPVMCAIELVKHCLENQWLRDETYCQIIKQLTGNPNPDSVRKGWDLMLICLHSFPPTTAFESFLQMFLRESKPPVSSPRTYINLMHKTMYDGAKMIPPSENEVNAWVRDQGSLDSDDYQAKLAKAEAAAKDLAKQKGYVLPSSSSSSSSSLQAPSGFGPPGGSRPSAGSNAGRPFGAGPPPGGAAPPTQSRPSFATPSAPSSAAPFAPASNVAPSGFRANAPVNKLNTSAFQQQQQPVPSAPGTAKPFGLPPGVPGMKPVPVVPSKPAPPAGPADSIDWHYVTISNESKGPVKKAAVRAAYQSNQMSDTSFVWNQSMDNWKALNEVSDLFEYAKYK